MVSDELKREARKAWQEYGQAIVKAFGFPEGSAIVADEVEMVLMTAPEARVRQFIKWVREQTEKVSAMEFLGE